MPSRARMAGCALAVAAFVVGLWWFIEVRSAPPPPPKVTIPSPGVAEK